MVAVMRCERSLHLCCYSHLHLKVWIVSSDFYELGIGKGKGNSL